MCKNAPRKKLVPIRIVLVKISIFPEGPERMNDWGENDINVVKTTHSQPKLHMKKWIGMLVLKKDVFIYYFVPEGPM